MKYFAFSDGIIFCENSGASIPHDELNVDYQEYLAWLSNGNEPLPWPPEVDE